MIYLFFIDINQLEVMNYIVKRLYPYTEVWTEDPIGPALPIKTNDVITHYYKCLHDYDSTGLEDIYNKDASKIPLNGHTEQELQDALDSCIIEKHENTQDVQSLLDAMLIANNKTI